MIVHLIPIWLSFLIAIALILLIARLDLGVGIFVGAIFLALMSFDPYKVDILDVSKNVFLNWEILFLAISVTLIPLLGGIMEESNLMIELIEKLDVPNRVSLMLSPAFFGLLPMPGGALLSAPLVDKIDPHLDPNKKVAINVWFREVIILIFPLQTTFFVLYPVLGYSSPYMMTLILLIPFSVMIVIGYFLLIGRTPKTKRNGNRNFWIFLRDLTPILIAPLIDLPARILIGNYEKNQIENPSIYPDLPNWLSPSLFLLIGLVLSVILCLVLAQKIQSPSIEKVKPKQLVSISKKMKIWRYPLLIYAMYFFIGVFKSSGLPEYISSLNAPIVLFLLISFLFGIGTGRVELPASILFPIFMTQYSISFMPYFEFALIYSAIFLGYLISFVHPCVAYSVDYFKTKYIKAFPHIGFPSFIALSLIFAVYGISLLF
jgi:hypothetical protein